MEKDCPIGLSTLCWIMAIDNPAAGVGACGTDSSLCWYI